MLRLDLKSLKISLGSPSSNIKFRSTSFRHNISNPRHSASALEREMVNQRFEDYDSRLSPKKHTIAGCGSTSVSVIGQSTSVQETNVEVGIHVMLRPIEIIKITHLRSMHIHAYVQDGIENLWTSKHKVLKSSYQAAVKEQDRQIKNPSQHLVFQQYQRVSEPDCNQSLCSS